MTNPLDESAVPLILDEPKHGRVGGISMMIRSTYRGASFKNEREIRSGASPVLSVNS